jgi:glutamyl-tRNA synthetase
MSPEKPVRVRIAPSPTGDPHVGTAYIALFNYVFARKHGGKFILRIEDTDRTRSTLESEAAIMRALRWLGLSWDEGPDVGGPHGPYRQSERAEIYRQHAELLLERGEAYRCFCTPARLDELRKARGPKGPTGYDRNCRGLPQDEVQARLAAGEPFVIRLKTPIGGETMLEDRLRGTVRFDNAQIDDQVLLKSDGFPTYHLANVVDDHLMGVSHVIRAEEWISSTPKHVGLYRAFGWEEPVWIHMPLLRNADKSKISKRKNPVSLDYYRDAGFLPEALLNYLGTMGWSFSADREKFNLAEMIEAFSWDRISLGGPVFDLVKLTDLNGQYLRELPPEQLIARLRAWRLGDDYLARLMPFAQPRIKRLDEFVPLTGFFFEGDLDYAPADQDFVPKGRTAAEVADALGAFVDAFDEPGQGTPRPAFEAASLEQVGRTLCEKLGWKPKELFTPLRLAVTARTAAPPLFDTMAVLGREVCRRRIRLAAERLRRQA